MSLSDIVGEVLCPRRSPTAT